MTGSGEGKRELKVSLPRVLVEYLHRRKVLRGGTISGYVEAAIWERIEETDVLTRDEVEAMMESERLESS